MKKIVSLALVLVMVMMVIPFSAMTAVASEYADTFKVSTPYNLARDKEVTTSRTNKGVSSAYHPLNFNADLTDGEAKFDSSPEAMYDNSWFAFQTYSNTVATNGAYGTVGEICIDLGTIANVTGVGIYTLEGCIEILDGTFIESHIESVQVYGKKNLNDKYIKIGSMAPSSYDNPSWDNCDIAASEVRYVKFAVNIETAWTTAVNPVVYALIGEIAVYGFAEVHDYYNNLATSASYKVYDDNGKEVKTTRGYTGKLNDGVMDAPVVSYLYNSSTGKYNANDGKWFGLFDNEAAADQNLPSGTAHIIFDLGKVAQVEYLRMFVPSDINLAPGYVRYTFSKDGVNYANGNSDITRAIDSAEYDNGYLTALLTAVECRYVKVTVKVSQYWALMSEIQIIGRYCDNKLVYYPETRDATGLLVTGTRGYYGCLDDGIYDVPVVSYMKNPSTGAYNCNDGNWFGLFCNSATPEANCTTQYAKTFLDLDAVCDVAQVRIFVPYDPNLSAHMVLVDVYDEEMNILNDYTEFYTIEGTYGYWKCFEFESIIENARYITVRFNFDGYWCLYNEIEVIGFYS